MKNVVPDLALFGGTPAFTETLVVGRPGLGDRARFFERLDQALDSGRLTGGGALVREFEQRIAELAGVRHCVATCNATVALEIVTRAAGLAGEIIMPSMTFIATAHAVRYLGFRPVFGDIDPVTGCLDPVRVEALITEDTSAIFGVHLWGQPCAVERLERIAEAHGLTLVYDAAHGIGCTYRNESIGRFGRAEVFSFNATKIVHSFEGGAVVTDDEELATRVRRMHNFGFVAPGRTGGLGTNAKMSEAAAAMGLTSLDAFDDVVALNRRHHERYRVELADLPGITVHDYGDVHRNNYQYVIVKVDRERSGLSRDLLLDTLRAENIHALTYFSPACHQVEPYRSEDPVVLPNTERLAEQVIALPTGPATTSADVEQVCEVVRFAVRHADEIHARRWQDDNPLPDVAQLV